MRVWRPGESPVATSRLVAEEVPIALSYNGEAYGVLMTTPQNLEDLALGFTLSEGIESDPARIKIGTAEKVDQGYVLPISLADPAFDKLIERRRAFAQGSSCGVCGVESIEAALRPLPTLSKAAPRPLPLIHAAMQELHKHQPLNAKTGAVHAAAYMATDGIIGPVREDVGRHNALDKLIGALAKAHINPADGTLLLTSRCSVELVQKAVIAGFPAMAAISAPTTLALDCAVKAKLALTVLVRDDSLIIACDPHDLFVTQTP